jgi:hypothetical protein
VPRLNSEWVGLLKELVVLATIVYGARQARAGHTRGLINSEKLDHVESVVNGVEGDDQPGRTKSQ